jgi:hypothetical protein
MQLQKKRAIISAIVLGISFAGTYLLFHRLTRSKERNPPDSHQPKTEEENKVMEPPVASKSDDPPTIKRCDDAYTKWYKSKETWRFIAEIITLLCFVPYVAFTYKQLRVNEAQLESFKQSVMDDRRAWIVMQNDFTTFQEKEGNVISFNVKNIGKTPAINPNNVIGYTTDIKQIPKQDYPLKGTTTVGYIAPGQSIGCGTPAFTSDVIAWFAQGHPIYIYGTYWYEDIFRNHHWFQFAFRGQVNSASPQHSLFFKIDIHNSCDDAEAFKPH